MLEAIQQLLRLQDHDRKIFQVQTELDGLAPQRQRLQEQAAAAQAQLTAARSRFQALEVERKQCELEVEEKKQLIAKYSIQQYQTKKNEEYRALTREVEQCQLAITQLEDRQLELMEQAETVHREIAAAQQAFQELNATVQQRLHDLATREQDLQQCHASLEADRSQIAAVVDPVKRNRYEHLFTHRGGRVIVGIERGVCGGCHMVLPPQVQVSCQAGQDLLNCPNCGRILYYAPEMDLTPSE